MTNKLKKATLEEQEAGRRAIARRNSSTGSAPAKKTRRSKEVTPEVTEAEPAEEALDSTEVMDQSSEAQVDLEDLLKG